MLPLIGGLIAAGAIGKGVGGMISANAASKAQQRGARQAAQTAQKYGDQAIGYQKPVYDIGMRGMQNLESNINSGAYDMQDMQYQQPTFDFKADPGYQFRLQQGNAAVQNSAAAQGKGLSGATLRALSRYGSGLASQEYQNAYDRFGQDRNFGYGVTRDIYDRGAIERNARYNRQSGLANYGANAANQMGNYAINTGNAVGNAQMGRANAEASGYMGMGNAASGMFDDAMTGGLALGFMGAPSTGGAPSSAMQFNGSQLLRDMPTKIRYNPPFNPSGRP